MTEEKLMDHIISRLEPQNFVDYVEVRIRKPHLTSYKLLLNHGEFNRFESQGVANNHRFDGGRRCGQSDHRFHNQGGPQGGLRNSAFRGQNDRNKYLNFLSDRCEYGIDRSRCTENPSDTERKPLCVLITK
ncbi:uncharacterized protein TNCV_2659371 [Trichonephila clavipes]|uniref:Uncharacterized protein n=1 Tax=Trichonephila clavipes TaxID=2585209 RepID=A0A8X6R501_TRICX|nr:uncharacterized protein TNCV_2659371 [Trichonephila clavipes]